MKTALPKFVLAGTVLCVLTLTAVGATGFTTQVSPSSQTNATEPSVAVDHSDGTIYVAWQAGGTWVARSDDGGRSFVQTPIADPFGRDIGDVDARVGGPTPCATPTTNCLPGTHRVYVSSIERAPLLLQTRLAFSDDRGAHWTINDLAAFNPSFVDRSSTNTDKIFATLGVDDSGVSGVAGNVYAVFADNLAAPTVWDIWFTHSSNRGGTWSPPVKVNNDRGTHFFPWIAAGSSGRVDFIWLTSPDTTPTDAEQSPWSVTFAQTTNGTSGTPKFNQTSASSNVMHVGEICTVGIFCSVTGGNRDLADSISVVIDRGGSAALAWTDQGRVLNGPTHITYVCVTAQQSAVVGAHSRLNRKGPARRQIP